MIAAGRLISRVRFEVRGEDADDGLGNVHEQWTPVAVRWAEWRPQYGREAVAAGRLEATRPGVLTIRRDATTAALTAAHRVVFVAGPEPAGTTAAIRSVLPLADDIEITLDVGAAT